LHASMSNVSFIKDNPFANSAATLDVPTPPLDDKTLISMILP